MLGGGIVAVAMAIAVPAPPSTALAPRQPLWSVADPRDLAMTFLTRDGDDDYAVVATDDGIRVDADAGNAESDTRVLLHRPTTPAVVDGESCATWGDRDGDLVQLGAALRIRKAGGAVRAITVTQNIWVSPFAFNIHTWDTSRPARRIRMVGQVDLRRRFFGFGLVSLPWHFCARAVGDRVEFKVWSHSEREPRWGDPSHSDGVTLPEGWVTPGHFGWYVGHLRAGDHATMDGMTIWAYRNQQSMIPRPRSQPGGR